MNDRSQAHPLGGLPTPAVAAGVPLPLAAGVMTRRGWGSVVVVDHGSVCGVLTEHDLLRAALEHDERNSLSAGDVCCRGLEEPMSTDPLLIGTDTTIADAARAMLGAQVGSAVALAGEAVRGVLTATDVTAASSSTRAGEETRVGDACVEVTPLSLDDGLERAMALAAFAGGRPVPVLEDGWPVGLLQIPVVPAAARPSEPALPLPGPSPIVTRRPGQGSRFYRAAFGPGGGAG